MAEIWKPIKGYEPFEISNRGRVRNIDIVEPSISASGFAEVQIENAKVEVHELVADHFLAPPMGAIKLRHIDGNKENNHCSNLEWETKPVKPRKTGKRNKITKEDTERIRELWQRGLKQNEIAKIFDITQQNVYLIVNGYTWREKVKE